MLKKLHWSDFPCIIAEGAVNNSGYVNLMCPRLGISRGAHVIACEEAHGLRPSGNYTPDHLCGNKRCMNPHHLEWVTMGENHRRRALLGRAKRVKFTDEQVLWAVKQVKELGCSQEDTAKALGTSSKNVWKWVSGQRRSKLTGIKYAPRPFIVHK